MKKCILLALILHSSFLYPMENDSWISALCLWGSHVSSAVQSFLPSRPPKESQLILDLRNRKNKLEEQLETYVQIRFHKFLSPFSIQIFWKPVAAIQPYEFLQYCYYQKYHDSEPYMATSHLDDDECFLELCMEASIGNCSALGAAILASDVSFKEKKYFIQTLRERGFVPTQEDIQLAEFVLYEEVLRQEQETKLKTKFIHLLHPNSPAYWRDVPQEVRKIIASYLLELIKKDYWLLPGY